jgi:hypothetical protein
MCERYKARLRRRGGDRSGGKARAVAEWQRFYNTAGLQKFRLTKSAMALRNRNAQEQARRWLPSNNASSRRMMQRSASKAALTFFFSRDRRCRRRGPPL